ncbi:MAG: GNAT family N-acetyltransferase [Lachnospiraceae bacterium]|nr:GNAT family N-acetyltransferase [Lachnospiraceae bacterium]
MILKANNEKNEVTFDLAGINDIEELIRLRILYMIDDFGSITEDEERCMREQLPDYFRRKLGKEVVAFVARAEGRLVACALLLVLEKPANPFLPNGFEGDVVGVYTEEGYRNRGICTTLMKNLVAYSKQHDLCRIELMATDDGYPIYKNIGFVDKAQKYRDMRFVIK